MLEALRKAEEMLHKVNEERRVLTLYERVWLQVKKPRDMAGAFMKQSNWYRVGSMYAKRLDEAGLNAEAKKIRTALGAN